MFVFGRGCRMRHSEPWRVLSKQRPQPVTNGKFRDRLARGLRVIIAEVSLCPLGSTCLRLSRVRRHEADPPPFIAGTFRFCCNQKFLEGKGRVLICSVLPACGTGSTVRWTSAHKLSEVSELGGSAAGFDNEKVTGLTRVGTRVGGERKWSYKTTSGVRLKCQDEARGHGAPSRRARVGRLSEDAAAFSLSAVRAADGSAAGLVCAGGRFRSGDSLGDFWL